MNRALLVAPLALTAVGCHPSKPAAAPASFVAHVEAGGTLVLGDDDDGEKDGDRKQNGEKRDSSEKEISNLGAHLSADVGFEATGCCGMGVYAARTGLGGTLAHENRASQILEGGLEFSAMFSDWVRLRLRAGRAGTPPQLPLYGRKGETGSVALLARLPHPPPAIGEPAIAWDLFLGLSAWRFGRERTAGGPFDGSYTTGALLFGLRVGSEYGVAFE